MQAKTIDLNSGVIKTVVNQSGIAGKTGDDGNGIFFGMDGGMTVNLNGGALEIYETAAKDTTKLANNVQIGSRKQVNLTTGQEVESGGVDLKAQVNVTGNYTTGNLGAFGSIEVVKNGQLTVSNGGSLEAATLVVDSGLANTGFFAWDTTSGNLKANQLTLKGTDANKGMLLTKIDNLTASTLTLEDNGQLWTYTNKKVNNNSLDAVGFKSGTTVILDGGEIFAYKTPETFGTRINNLLVDSGVTVNVTDNYTASKAFGTVEIAKNGIVNVDGVTFDATNLLVKGKYNQTKGTSHISGNVAVTDGEFILKGTDGNLKATSSVTGSFTTDQSLTLDNADLSVGSFNGKSVTLSNASTLTMAGNSQVNGDVSGTDTKAALTVTGVTNVTGQINLVTLAGSGTTNMDVQNVSNSKINTVKDGVLAVNASTNSYDSLTMLDSLNDSGVVGSDKLVDTLANGGQVKVAEGLITGSTTTNASNKQESVNTVNKGLLDSLMATSGVARMDINDIHKRMGDLKGSAGRSGAWVRYDGGKFSGNEVKNTFHKVQIGADAAVNNSFRIGLAGSYTKSDVDFARNGSSNAKTYGGSIYGVWMAENGVFVDVIARYGNQDIDAKTINYKADLSGSTYGASLEFGRRFQAGQNGFFEPQMEIAYTKSKGDSFNVKDANFKIDDQDSLIGRVGFATGLNFEEDKGNVYLRFGVLREFKGDGQMTGINGGLQRVIKTDGKETWIEYAVGGQYNVGKNAYIYGDVERTSGANVNEDYRVNVGFRYNF